MHGPLRLRASGGGARIVRPHVACGRMPAASRAGLSPPHHLAQFRCCHSQCWTGARLPLDAAPRVSPAARALALPATSQARGWTSKGLCQGGWAPAGGGAKTPVARRCVPVCVQQQVVRVVARLLRAPWGAFERDRQVRARSARQNLIRAPRTPRGSTQRACSHGSHDAQPSARAVTI
jgi:hypothetical protein